MPRNKRKRRRNTPEILDLHGLDYETARSTTIRFLESRWNSGKEVHVITGNSYDMQQHVIKVFLEYKLTYEVGDHFNTGYLKTWLL